MMKRIVLLIALLPVLSLATSDPNISPAKIVNVIPYYDSVTRGLVPGVSSLLIRGHATDVDIADGDEDLWEQGGNLTYLTSAETMNIASTSTADDDDPAGTGCHKVLVQGLDGSYEEVSETVVLNGTSNVLTTNSYLRVRALVCIEAGTGLTNAGNLSATASSAATVQSLALAGEAISHDVHYTVPLRKSMRIIRGVVNASKTGAGQSPVVEVKAFGRQIALFGSNAPWVQLFDKKLDTALSNEIPVELPVTTLFNAKDELKITASTDKDDTDVRVRIYALVYEN